MVEIRAVYEGALRCRVTHGPSGQSFLTDAPMDNQGRGEAISPTDLVAAALGTCMLTTMGIVAARHRLDLAGTRVQVLKHMVNEPSRRIGRLEVRIEFAAAFAPADRQLLERTAAACPVHHSLHDVEIPVAFIYPE
jgi:putative redox protein